MLQGRDVEQARIAALLDAARSGSGGALVVRGQPGVGKSSLIADAAARAGGMTVLRTQGVESESPLAFAALQRLLRLDPLRAENGHPLGSGGRVRDQRRLAHARLATDHQSAAGPGPRRVEQCGDPRLLDVPALQHRGSLELHVVGSVPYPASGALRRRRVRQQGVTVARKSARSSPPEARRRGLTRICGRPAGPRCGSTSGGAG